MIEIRVYKNAGKIKQITCKYNNGFKGVNSYQLTGILKDRKDDDFVFIDVNNNKKDITRESLINILKANERRLVGEKIDLNKIIRAGGFVEYIKQHE